MPSSVFARRLKVLTLVAAVGFCASACGRMGPLEPPPSANAVAAKPADAADPTEPQKPKKAEPIKATPRPFVLDPLL